MTNEQIAVALRVLSAYSLKNARQARKTSICFAAIFLIEPSASQTNSHVW